MKLKLAEQWEGVINAFENHYPEIADKTVDWYPTGCQEITVRLSDKSKYTYNWRTQKLTRVYDRFAVDIHGELDDISEEMVKERFIASLKQKMDDMSVCQEELSCVTGISRVTINRYLCGKALPNYNNLRKLSMALKCSPTELYIYR